MKRFLFLSFLLLTICVIHAQRVYFIYIQSDNNTPFYVKMNDKVYSSSLLGYLILSKLKDSIYTFSVGRPATQTAELRFSVTINGGDKGFLLRQSNNSYNLFDLNTMSIINPINNTGGGLSVTKKTDLFTKMLSEVANDSSLLEVPVAIKEDKKTKSEEPAPQKKESEIKTVSLAQSTTIEKDTAVVVKSNETKTEVKVESGTNNTEPETTAIISTKSAENTTPNNNINNKQVDTAQNIPAEQKPQFAEQAVFKRSIVTRRSESSTTEGFGLVFLDNQDGVVDTIRLLIPNAKITIQQEAVVKNEEAATATSNAINKVNPMCQSIASENDFLRVRKVMAAENNDNDMIDEARKVFRKKCFTTEQIRNLSLLFLTAEGKYNFFDAAFRFTSDLAQFSSLESELKNENYVKRFRTLVGQ